MVTLRLVALLSISCVLGLTLCGGAETKENPKVDELATEGYWLPDQKDAFDAAMAMLHKPAPMLGLSDWRGKPVTVAARKGNIVLIDFWATWCGPCLEQIPHANEIAKKYADQKVIVFGACCHRGADVMAKTAADNGMTYPTAKIQAQAEKVWKISFWPTYAIIDRNGKVRAIGLNPDYVERVLDELLIEQPPPDDKK